MASPRHVVVIDDDAIIRELASTVLGNAGFTVTLADSADGALKLLLAGTLPAVDVVLLDLRMPGLSGAPALRAIRGVLPRARIVVSSGLDRADAVGELALEPGVSVLRKPYAVARLLAAVRAAADAVPSADPPAG